MKILKMLPIMGVAALAIVALCNTPAVADFINGDFENTTVTNQDSWTAGTDALGSWYGGSGWGIAGATGSKYADETDYGPEGLNVLYVNRLVQALPIAAGDFNWSLVTRENDNNDSYGLVVLLANDGATISLTGGPFYPWLGAVPSNTEEALRWDPEVEDNQQPLNPGSMMPSDGAWHSISDTFTISAADAAAYKYVVFVAEGNVSPGSVLSIDSMSTDLHAVPEPSSLGWHLPLRRIGRRDRVRSSTIGRRLCKEPSLLPSKSESHSPELRSISQQDRGTSSTRD